MTLEMFFMGLDERGASLALALSEADLGTNHRGYDSDREAARAAQEAGAVEGLVLNPYKAVRSADVIVLSLPTTEATEYLREITPNLKSSAIVLDCSPLKSGNLAWARKNFKEKNEYIGALPILPADRLLEPGSAPANIRPDLYQESTLALVIPPEASEQALTLAVNISQAIGAEPFFIEAAELDAIGSLSDALPAVLSAALVRVAASTRGWPNFQRVAGRTFAAATRLAAEQDPGQLSKELLANQGSLLAHLRALVEELTALQQMLNEGDQEGLEDVLKAARGARATWIEARQRSDWRAQELTPAEGEGTGLWGRLLGIDPQRRKRKD